MATTETRTGFRLPWSTEHRASDSTSAAETAAALEATDAGANAEPDVIGGHAALGEADDATPATADRSETGVGAPTMDAPLANESTTPEVETTDTPMLDMSTAPIPPRAPAAPAKRPTKFLADLTNAMRTAAEAERTDILERFRADAKAFVELVQERSGGEAVELRKQTDDDVASIREWSKAEIARIREETDERITHRKARLDRELEAHAARIEHDIERVNARVEGFEASMTRFFEGLLTEDDPTSFAERAANLPEPPSLEDVLDGDDQDLPTPAHRPVATATPEHVAEPAPVATVEARTVEAVTVETEPEATPVIAEAQPEASAEEAPPVTEEPASETLDPRVAALGLSPDFAAAEAEAFQVSDDGSEPDAPGEDIPALDDDTIAARLAGLPQGATESQAEMTSTQVVVTGLVSVASIAGFKRHLSRLAGIRSVGVSSGPEGEFLFTVAHGPDAALHDAIPTIPGFAARITQSGEGVLHVTARDPEADS